MFLDFQQLSPLLYNQTDRIQGMARYMNNAGSSSEGMTLLIIAVGMITVVLLLKIYANHKQKQAEIALKQKLRKRKNAEKRAEVARRNPTARRQAPVRRR